MSKRKLLTLVKDKHVRGWDDPRMPTISGLRRRGYTPEAIRAFCERIGVSKYEGTIEMAWLEDALRDDLNRKRCGAWRAAAAEGRHRELSGRPE